MEYDEEAELIPIDTQCGECDLWWKRIIKIKRDPNWEVRDVYDDLMDERDMLGMYAGHRTLVHKDFKIYSMYVNKYVAPCMKPKLVEKHVTPDDVQADRCYKHFITYTCKPSVGLHELLSCLDFLRNSKIPGTNKFEACLELTKSGEPHLHVLLWSTKKYMDKTKLKSVGHVDVKKVKDSSDVIKIRKYMAKMEEDPQLIKYCEENKCEREYKYNAPKI